MNIFKRRRIGLESKVMASIGAVIVLMPAQLTYGQGDSGFLRGKGNLDVAATYAYETYDEFWIGSDTVDDAPFGRVTRQSVNVYGAYGLRDNMDIALSGSWVFVSTDEIFDDVDALQDLTAQLKWRGISKEFGPGKLNLLAAPAVKIPMTHYEDNNVPAVGDGNVDLRLRGIAQYVFDNGAFIALDTGYDIRFDDPHDEVPIHVTAGMTFFEKLTVMGFYTHIESLGGHDIGEGSFPGVEEEYDRIGGGMYYRLTESWGVTANGWTTLDGKNTGDVDGFSIGMVYRF